MGGPEGFGTSGGEDFGFGGCTTGAGEGSDPSGETGTRGGEGGDGLGDGEIGVLVGVFELFGGWGSGFDGDDGVGLGVVGRDGGVAVGVDGPARHPLLSLLQSTGWLMTGKHALGNFWFGLLAMQLLLSSRTVASPEDGKHALASPLK